MRSVVRRWWMASVASMPASSHGEHDCNRLQLARAAILHSAFSFTSFSRISSSFSFSFAAVSNSTLSEAKRWSSWFFSRLSEVALYSRQHLEARRASCRAPPARATVPPTCCRAHRARPLHGTFPVRPRASAGCPRAGRADAARCRARAESGRAGAHRASVASSASARFSVSSARRESPVALATAASPRSAYASPRA